MIFRRKKKNAGDVSSSDEIEGVIRRGLAETTGRTPHELSAPRRSVRDSNPYNLTGRAIKGPPKSRAGSKASGFEGPGNPYDNASIVPDKKKRSWDDV